MWCGRWIIWRWLIPSITDWWVRCEQTPYYIWKGELIKASWSSGALRSYTELQRQARGPAQVFTLYPGNSVVITCVPESKWNLSSWNLLCLISKHGYTAFQKAKHSPAVWWWDIVSLKEIKLDSWEGRVIAADGQGEHCTNFDSHRSTNLLQFVLQPPFFRNAQ